MINEQTWVAAIATSGSLPAIRVFMKHKIDFCCGGKRPLGEVCASKGLSTPDVIAELESALAEAGPDQVDWSTAPIPELINRILDRHHAYLRSELPRLSGWLEKVYHKYGQQDAAILGGLPEIFEGLKAELESHIVKEEVILFPHALRLAAAIEQGEELPDVPFGSFEGPLHCMEAEHESAGAALEAIRKLTVNFTPPPHACTTYRALFAGLHELEADLHLHIHLENNILFGRVRAMVESGHAVGV